MAALSAFGHREGLSHIASERSRGAVHPVAFTVTDEPPEVDERSAGLPGFGGLPVLQRSAPAQALLESLAEPRCLLPLRPSLVIQGVEARDAERL